MVTDTRIRGLKSDRKLRELFAGGRFRVTTKGLTGLDFVRDFRMRHDL